MKRSTIEVKSPGLSSKVWAIALRTHPAPLWPAGMIKPPRVTKAVRVAKTVG